MRPIHSRANTTENQYGDSLATALQTLLSLTEKPEDQELARAYLRQFFRNQPDNIPFPILNLGRKVMEEAIKDALAEKEYRDLFKQFANDPYLLAKILIKKDPDRFFSEFLVAWNLSGFLSEYLQADDGNETVEPIENGGGGGGKDGGPKTPNDPDGIDPRNTQRIIEGLKDHLKHMDEEDIFEFSLPLFKQRVDKDKDGFGKGYEALASLLGTLKEGSERTKVQNVMGRFHELMQMTFGQFLPHLKRKNFPYMTVRRAIKTMEQKSAEGGPQRRFAHFDTRTGKTSLAILEPEYLKKNRALYICPPDTIPTILREYELYGGDATRIKVVRSEEGLQTLLAGNGHIRYCVIPATLLIKNSEHEIGGIHETTDEIETALSSIEADPDEEDTLNGDDSRSLESMRRAVNPTVLRLFNEWRPDYIAVDEVRHFAGYHCEPNMPSSKRSQALLYLLNSPEGLALNTTVRLLDATPGDLPRHYYPLLSILYPEHYPTPLTIRNEVGTKPFALMALFSEKADSAIRDQVYSPPPIRNIRSNAAMGPAQDAIYQYAAKHSTPNSLHRLTLARIASFNPALLKPFLRRLIQPMEGVGFKAQFDLAYDEWRSLSAATPTPFTLDRAALSGDRQFLLNAFAFPEHFESLFIREPDKLAALRTLPLSVGRMSCKAEYAIRRIKDAVQKSKTGERHSKRIIIYSSFKRGLTRDFNLANTDGTPNPNPIDIESGLAEQISREVPEANVYRVDGGLAMRIGKDGFSARDHMRSAWRDDDGINVLLAVGPATCQGIDLSTPNQTIEEIYLDIPMDSRMDYQIRSRTIGPGQNRTVSKETLIATTADGGNSIDNGIADLVRAKQFFRDLVCRKAISAPKEFLEAIENNESFLGEFCQSENSGEEVVESARKNIDQKLKS